MADTVEVQLLADELDEYVTSKGMENTPWSGDVWISWC